jgi:hypothetical protein
MSDSPNTPAYKHHPMLPWSDASGGRFKPILAVALIIVMIFGVIIPTLMCQRSAAKNGSSCHLNWPKS